MADYQRSDYYFSRSHSGIPPTPIDAPLRGYGRDILAGAGFAVLMAALIYLTCAI